VLVVEKGGTSMPGTCNRYQVPATEESELVATMAELETGGGAALETGAVRFSARNAATKVGKDW